MTNTARPIVFVARHGIGNRLRALAGYLSLAQLRGVPLRMCWLIEPGCNARFDELFSTPIELIDEAELASLQASNECQVLSECIWFDKIWRDFASDVEWSGFRDACLRQLRGLTPVPELLASIDAFSTQHALHETLGVHVRWTDNLHAYPTWAERSRPFQLAATSTLLGFERRIEAALEAHEVERVFLATDHADVERALRERFGARLLVWPKRFITVPRPQSAQSVLRGSALSDAIVELYLLSRCRALVGTYFSSFSKLAAVIGGVPYQQIEGEACVTPTQTLRLQGLAP